MKFPTAGDAPGHAPIRSSTTHSEESESESDTKTDRPSIDDLESLQVSPSYFQGEDSLTDVNDSVAAPNNDNITSNDKLTTTTTTTKEKEVLVYPMQHEKAEHNSLETIALQEAWNQWSTEDSGLETNAPDPKTTTSTTTITAKSRLKDSRWTVNDNEPTNEATLVEHSVTSAVAEEPPAALKRLPSAPHE